MQEITPWNKTKIKYKNDTGGYHKHENINDEIDE